MALGNNGLSSMRQMVVNDELWANLSQAQRWALNRQWLRSVISAGNEVVVAGKNVGLQTLREIDFLMNAGYVPIRNSAGRIVKLVPGG